MQTVQHAEVCTNYKQVTLLASLSSEVQTLICLPVHGAPAECYYNSLLRCDYFSSCVWYRTLSLRYVCIRSLGIILISYATFVPNYVSFSASIAQPAHGEKLCTQSISQSLNHSSSLFDAPGTKVLALQNMSNVHRCNIQWCCFYFRNLSTLSHEVTLNLNVQHLITAINSRNILKMF